MADFLIRDMKMPKDIEPRPVIEFADGAAGERYARLFHYRYGALTEWLEVIELPPHGDLIDRNAAIKESEKPTIFDLTDVPDFLHEQPVIIPADKETQNAN